MDQRERELFVDLLRRRIVEGLDVRGRHILTANRMVIKKSTRGIDGKFWRCTHLMIVREESPRVAFKRRRPEFAGALVSSYLLVYVAERKTRMVVPPGTWMDISKHRAVSISLIYTYTNNISRVKHSQEILEQTVAASTSNIVHENGFSTAGIPDGLLTDPIAEFSRTGCYGFARILRT